MDKNRKTAVIVGILFIVATVFYMIGQITYGSIIQSSDYLENAYPSRSTIIAGVLVELAGILAIPLIAVYLHPVLKQYDRGLSVGYIAFRSLEAALLMGVAVCSLSLIQISQGYLDSVSSGQVLFQELGTSIRAVSHWTFLFAVGLVFPITALMLNTVLYRARLVPSFISIWGLLAASLLFVGNMMNMLEFFAGASELILELILTIPIAINEMVLALWLILKGFSLKAVTSSTIGDRQA